MTNHRGCLCTVITVLLEQVSDCVATNLVSYSLRVRDQGRECICAMSTRNEELAKVNFEKTGYSSQAEVHDIMDLIVLD